MALLPHGMHSIVHQCHATNQVPDQVIRETLDGAGSNVEMYEEFIQSQSYEKEAAAKDTWIQDLETELNTANKKSPVGIAGGALTVELETERAVDANLTIVSELRMELEVATTLPSSSGTRRRLRCTRPNCQRAELERLVKKTKESLIKETKRQCEALDEKGMRIA